MWVIYWMKYLRYGMSTALKSRIRSEITGEQAFSPVKCFFQELKAVLKGDTFLAHVEKKGGGRVIISAKDYNDRKDEL